MRAPAEYSKLRIDRDDVHRDVEMGKGSTFNIEFTFDCDVRCAITIYYFCSEEYTPNGVTYVAINTNKQSQWFPTIILCVFAVTSLEIQP